ncbi:MAG: uroporphyrinogen decarboxylase [Terriglobales bacterium]
MPVADRFLRACRRESVDVTPVWFMRQAGRYMAEYRALRRHHSILEICKTPELAAEVTVTAAEKLGVDAAIIFADLLLPVEPMGLHLEFRDQEGPVITPAVRDRAAVDALQPDLGGALGYVSEAIRRVATHFDGRLPVIGFAGAPFTLASYLIEGGASRTFLHTKRLMYREPETWNELMNKLCAMLVPFLREQVAAGARALQLFDSWVGTLGEDDFRRYVLPYIRSVVDAVQRTDVPVIYFSTGTSGYPEAIAETGAMVISLDWRAELAATWERLSPASAVQGNLDPVTLFAPERELRRAVQHVLRQVGGRPGHIFNLGHGILPGTPVEQVQAAVKWVHDYPLQG